MAGDWLKIETATPDKPEVFAIAAKMGWDDPDLAVGKLFRVWRWFDQHTSSGNAPSVTLALLDRICGVTGFAEAMQSVGWLVVDSAGVSLPNFDRHCGKTAKDRALTAKRVANHKSNAKGNGESVTSSVTSALPREEKRREDISQEPKIKVSCPADAGPPTAPTRFGEFWAVYPDKTGKKPSFDKWKAKRLDGIADRIIADVTERKARDRKWLDGFIPNPLTYLNQERWNDPVQESRPVQQPTRPPSKQVQGMQAILDMRKHYGLDGGRSDEGHRAALLAFSGSDTGSRLDEGDDSDLDRGDTLKGAVV